MRDYTDKIQKIFSLKIIYFLTGYLYRITLFTIVEYSIISSKKSIFFFIYFIVDAKRHHIVFRIILSFPFMF